MKRVSIFPGEFTRFRKRFKTKNIELKILSEFVMNTNSVDFFQNEIVAQLPENCELTLAVWKIKNPENMGNIIRMGHNLGVKEVLFISENQNKREHRIAKTAGLSFEKQKWNFISEKDFFALAGNETEIVVLETCSGSTNIFETKLPKQIILLGGNESHGLPADIIGKSKCKIFIPMPGGSKSMNVSHALTVAAFEWYRQISLQI